MDTKLRLGKHITFERREAELALCLHDLGRLEHFELALALPPRSTPEHLATAGPLGWRLPAFVNREQAPALCLFALALVVYAVTRLFALDQFPIYFFTDEAIHPVLGLDLLRSGLRYQGTWLPSYFQNGLYWNLSLSVYIHALTASLFGETIFVTRATSSVISLFGAAAVGLFLKFAFKLKWWWIVVLFLTVTPAWFLHSRTAFETVLMVSFYAWFLLCYLLYRQRSPNYLFPALVFGAATFYSYSNGQAVMAASGILLLVSDLRYHLRNWRTGLRGVALLVLLALPYVRFRIDHPDAISSQLRILDSYWLQSLPLQQKVAQFLSNLAYGVSPQYWFIPNDADLIRHRMKDYGNLSLWLLPFFIVGLVVSLRRIKSSVYRIILIAALAAPVGSALAQISITRALLFIVPANVLGVLGFNAVLAWFKSQRVQWGLALASFVVLSALSFGMLRDALVNGPTWYDNYGLFGMAWGTRQLFVDAIPEYAAENPTGPIYLTSTWANGTDVFLRFFPVPAARLMMYNIDYFTAYKRDLAPDTTLIMTPEELQRAGASGKFKLIDIAQVLKYPDGNDGFYFARLQYVDNIDAIFAAEREARRQLVVDTYVLDGEPIQVAHSVFDAGQVKDLFDGDPYTLVRGLEANPLIIEISFSKPRKLSGLAATFGKMNFALDVLLYPDGSQTPVEYTGQYYNLPPEPQVDMTFDRGPVSVTKIHMEIKDVDVDEPDHIHVRDLILR